LPGVREGIEQRHWEDVSKYVNVITETLNAYCDRLDKIKTADQPPK